MAATANHRTQAARGPGEPATPTQRRNGFGATIQLQHLLVIAAVAAVLSGCRACGARGGLPPAPPPMESSSKGPALHVVDHGEYKAYYDEWGRLARIEQDSNKDGRPDRISHHENGAKVPNLIEIDQDFDGTIDRWEYYDASGKLLRVGASRRGGAPDTWVYRDAQGRDYRREYDDDGDGRPERAEILVNGRVVRTEVDSDRDGQFDRWQEWSGGHLIGEDLDTDADGHPDRHVSYDSRGRPVTLAPAH